MDELSFTVYPAIDLRGGRVVRLRQGDPHRETVYGGDAMALARHWLSQGATWLHVVNLDGAFGAPDAPNREALRSILRTGARVQFGGGLRTLEEIAHALDLGVARVVLGTAAVEDPSLVGEAVTRFGDSRVAIGLDVRDGRVRVRGWREDSGLDAIMLGRMLYGVGVRWAVFTNIARDGVGHGLDIPSARDLMQKTGLKVIASGGVNALTDIVSARNAGLAGVIVGRALYERCFTLQEALRC
ncbi:MAG: 1-(5-phosphoribosyl)-5-[(5-phosphoribosylamino)methylideneamino]imidazole-4-carboxamide isomerase [Anaerolineae bacterium]|nr:MAG: 1-(5-phosphoribosyl)-5-[(5-phosphoribosylamino)methylideneamino]imidazole-4-carboxamide isomerase [Anaerolineae bacterium]